MPEHKIRVDFEPFGKRVDIAPGQTLLDAARLAGLPLTSDCGGGGSCGQCVVIVRDQPDALSALTTTETDILSAEQLQLGQRLACQAELLHDVKVDVPFFSLITGQRLQVESATGEDFLPGTWDDLIVKPYQITVPPATLHDLRGDLDRVLDVLGEIHGYTGLSASPMVVRLLPDLLRQYHWQVKVLLRGSVIVNFLPPNAHPLGVAVDLGTTKVAAYLVDLTNGVVLAAEGRPNPQIGYGEDVISRMVYVKNKPESAAVLSQAVVGVIDELTQLLTAQVQRSLQEVAEVCIVGNTAMTHLLLQLPVGQLAMAPYVPAAAAAQEMRAADLGLSLKGDVRVHVPPCVAGYVGADLVAMALASAIGQDDRTVLGIDIGTNTEIILSKRGTRRLVALSCASGPAFEGAHIRFGMRAAAGAIERVWLKPEGPVVQTIGNGPAVGICGSGIIDVIAEMHRVGVLNTHGRIQAGQPGVQPGVHSLEFLLVPAEQTATGEAILISQHDVDEILLAKGAIMAGIQVLLAVSDLQAQDLDEIILAGAFGTYLNLDTAIAISLVPNIPQERFRQVGNAAGDGARQILFSHTARKRALQLAREIEYVELTVYPGFRKHYARSMWL